MPVTVLSWHTDALIARDANNADRACALDRPDSLHSLFFFASETRALPRDSQLEKAVDMAQETQALFTNFDSSVYTIIFIPPDEGGVLPPGAEKYLNQVMVALLLDTAR